MKLQCSTNFQTLYKYTKQVWLADMLEMGLFRIGTLYEYRRYEHAEIGDADEGYKQFAFLEPTAIAGLTSRELNACYPKLYLRDDPRRVVLPAEDAPVSCSVALDVHSPDCYLFCMSEVFDVDTMRRLGYDACVEITNPSRFFSQLSTGMRTHANFGSMDRCYYGHRHGQYEVHRDERPQILKPLVLQHQREVRILWDPRVASNHAVSTPLPLSPIFLCRRKASKLLRRVA